VRQHLSAHSPEYTRPNAIGTTGQLQRIRTGFGYPAAPSRQGVRPLPRNARRVDRRIFINAPRQIARNTYSKRREDRADEQPKGDRLDSDEAGDAIPQIDARKGPIE
jgi:hypothetical protein